jgi:hypothetical protein
MVATQQPVDDGDVVDAEFVPPAEYADDWAVAERLTANESQIPLLSDAGESQTSGASL